MRTHREVASVRVEVSAITCNRCGKCFGAADVGGITRIVMQYGWGSSKDGDAYYSDVCEPCMDEFYASFKIAPQIVSTAVYGDPLDEPIRLEPAKENPP